MYKLNSSHKHAYQTTENTYLAIMETIKQTSQPYYLYPPPQTLTTTSSNYVTQANKKHSKNIIKHGKRILKYV